MPALRAIIRTVAAVVVACLAAPLAAQTAWPSRTVRIIVPAPAGTAPDIFARLYAEHLGRGLGQSFVVENRAGASGNIGADAVAKAPADGYTLLYAYNQIPTMNPHLFSRMGYDPIKDLAPVAQTLTTAYVLLGHNNFPAENFAAVLDYAKRNPGKVAYASYGPGTASHLIFELIQERTGTQFLHVPYKQGQVADVISGQVAMVIEPFASAVPMAKSGKTRALAVTSPKRIAALPATATLGEAIAGLDLVGWNAVWVPAGTPADIVNRLNAEIVRITRLPEMQKRIVDAASEPTGTTPAETAATIQREYERWGAVIRAKNIRLD